MRRVVRVIVILALMLTATIGLAGSASAADAPDIFIPPCSVKNKPGCEKSQDLTIDCKGAPSPQVPGRGVTSFFSGAPKTLPADEDPFAPGATVSVYQVYGYAGLRFPTYDLGCGPDLVRNPDASIGTAIANWIFQAPKAMVAATGGLVSAAYEPTFLAAFDPLISRVVDALRKAIFERWLFLVLGGLGLLIIVKARKQRLQGTATAIGWALLIMVLATAVFRWPLMAGHAADQSATSVLATVNSAMSGQQTSGDAGDAATSGMHSALLYTAWLGGTFGSSDSPTALTYGPRIFKDTALSWREAAILRSDPEAGERIIKLKQIDFEAAAEEIKTKDPEAYDYLTGKVSDDRVGYAVLALIATLCTIPFLFASGLLVIGALIIVRFGVMLFPAFATLGMFPAMRSLVTGLASSVVAALLNAVIFGIGASTTVLIMGVLLSPASHLTGWLSILLMLLTTIIMWVVLRPFRRLTQFVRPSEVGEVFSDAASAPGRVAVGAAKVAGRVGVQTAAIAGAALGGAAAAGGVAAVTHRAESESDPVVRVVATASDLPSPTSPPAPVRVALPGGGEAPRRAPGPEPTPAPTVQPFVPPAPRAGDDGTPVEGTVLPPARYEMEDV